MGNHAKRKKLVALFKAKGVGGKLYRTSFKYARERLSTFSMDEMFEILQHNKGDIVSDCDEVNYHILGWRKRMNWVGLPIIECLIDNNGGVHCTCGSTGWEPKPRDTVIKEVNNMYTSMSSLCGIISMPDSYYKEVQLKRYRAILSGQTIVGEDGTYLPEWRNETPK